MERRQGARLAVDDGNVDLTEKTAYIDPAHLRGGIPVETRRMGNGNADALHGKFVGRLTIIDLENAGWLDAGVRKGPDDPMAHIRLQTQPDQMISGNVGKSGGLDIRQWMR